MLLFIQAACVIEALAMRPIVAKLDISGSELSTKVCTDRAQTYHSAHPQISTILVLCCLDRRCTSQTAAGSG